MAPRWNSLGAPRGYLTSLTLESQQWPVSPSILLGLFNSLHLLRKTGELKKGKLEAFSISQKREIGQNPKGKKKKKTTLQVTK